MEMRRASKVEVRRDSVHASLMRKSNSFQKQGECLEGGMRELGLRFQVSMIKR